MSGKDVRTYIERFDPYLEKWAGQPLKTKGIPHPGQFYAACASYEEFMYLYGGYNREEKPTGVISSLNLKTLQWRQVCAKASGGPKQKIGLCMVYFNDRKLMMVCGYGPRTPTDNSSSFVKDEDDPNYGWSKKVHVLHISEGIKIML